VLIKFFLSLLLFLVGGAAAYFLSRIATMECVRDRSGVISTTILRTGIRYRQKERIPAGELLRAELDALHDSDSPTTYRIRLVALNSTIFLTPIYSGNYTDVSNKVDQINYFINASSQRAISITQDDRLGGYLIGAAFWMAGVIVLLSPIHG
jgi:hypothetical protein